MEWMVEGFSLIFIAMLVLVLTVLGDFTNQVLIVIYWMCALMLIALAILSLFTGFKVNFPHFKLCPVIFTASALLIIFGVQ